MNRKIVENIIGRFGGQTALGEAISTPQSTIAWWKKRGSIPDRHKVRILLAAAKRGITLAPSDFLATEPDGDSAAIDGSDSEDTPESGNSFEDRSVEVAA